MKPTQQILSTMRVVVVDDERSVRTGLRDALCRSSVLEFVGEARDGEEAVRVTRRTHPDVVLMDVAMPVMNGVEATRRICQDPHTPTPRVLMLTSLDDDDRMFDAIRAGASGFLPKTSASGMVVEAITTVCTGGAVLSPGVARRLLAEVAGPVVESPVLAPLTDRELEVFRLLLRGLRNDEIASHLVVGGSTVKSHLHSLYQKLGVRDRVQAVIYAYERGLLQATGAPRTASRRR